MRIQEYKKSTLDVQNAIDSRYFGTALLEDAGIVFRATYPLKSIELADTDVFTRVRADEVGRLDLVAKRVYNNPKLYWFIAQANEIINPIEDVLVNTPLRIPKYTAALNVE